MNKSYALSIQLGTLLKEKQWFCAVAESCTGGGLAFAITDVAGSSQWFDRGFVTYTNQAKHEMLGVAHETLTSHGAVSEATVRAMASGALAHSPAQVSIAISGVAGPQGGSPEKPVGTVWIAWAIQSQITAQGYHFPGNRNDVRDQAIEAALKRLIELISA